MKYRIFRNISVLCPSLLPFHSYLLIFPFHPLSIPPLSLSIPLSSFIFIFFLYSSLFLTVFLQQSSSISFPFQLIIYLYLSLCLSLFLALLIYSDFGFVYASCWLIGFSESACNTRTLPVTLYAFHIYVKYTRVMSVD